MGIYELLEKMNQENGSIYKMQVVEEIIKSPDSKIFQRVVRMALDKVKYKYGITLKNIQVTGTGDKGIEWGLDQLDDFQTRKVTGNAAIERLEEVMHQMAPNDQYVLKRVIDRDLKVNFGRSLFNKLLDKDFKITKPPYMRCGIFNQSTAKNIPFPAYIQLKADGKFCAVHVEQGKVSFIARSGEENDLPHLTKLFSKLQDGVYIGELLVRGTGSRSVSNGLLNSDKDKCSVYIQLWDYVTFDEYYRPKDKKNKTQYSIRFNALTSIINTLGETDKVNLIESYSVKDLKEALVHVNRWMTQGLEGGILKSPENIFLDHTSPTQLKLKLEIDADLRITGFSEGKVGSKRAKTFGAMLFENDEGTISGRTSGFSDKQLKDFNSRRGELIGRIMTVQFNDITRARNSETYALSHPRFITLRDDKDTTDTLARVQEMKAMAMEIGNISKERTDCND